MTEQSTPSDLAAWVLDHGVGLTPARQKQLAKGYRRLEAQSDIRGRAVVIYRDRARQAEAARDQAYEWADDQSHPLVMRQGETLTGVANALNGPTPPRTSWSHHDLAEKAAAVVTRAEQAEERIKAVRDVLDRKDADLDAMSNPPREHRGVLMADIRRALDT